jgi:hypothetical protein
VLQSSRVPASWSLARYTVILSHTKSKVSGLMDQHPEVRISAKNSGVEES